MLAVTVNQIQALWADPSAVIDRGEDAEPVTQDDLSVLDVDTDDDGMPLADQWQIMADQINSNVPGEPSSTAGQLVLQEIADARAHRDRVKEQADEEFNSLIRAAVVGRRASVIDIALAAGVTRARIYQIRDGRR